MVLYLYNTCILNRRVIMIYILLKSSFYINHYYNKLINKLIVKLQYFNLLNISEYNS